MECRSIRYLKILSAMLIIKKEITFLNKLNIFKYIYILIKIIGGFLRKLEFEVL